MRTLGSYGANTGMIIYVNDMNPNSIHKEIENIELFHKGLAPRLVTIRRNALFRDLSYLG